MRYLWLSLLACWACSASAQLVVNGVDYSSNPGLGRQVQADEMAKQHMMQQQQMQQTWQAPPTIVRNITVYVPNRFGAVAVNYQKSHVVMVSNRISREEAEAAAQAQCKKAAGAPCEHFVSFGNECAALAQGVGASGGKSGFRLVMGSVHPDLIGLAEEDALQKCRDEGLRDCRIIIPEECSFFPEKLDASVSVIEVPSRFGAIAVKLEAPSDYASSTNHVSREEAEAAALSACRARGKTGNCQIFVSYGNECVAMVEGLQRENGKKEPYLMYSTVPPEREGTAEDDAMRKCTERGYEECRVVLPEECSQYIYEPIRPLRG